MRSIPTPDYKALFEAAPGHYLVLLPDLTIVAVSDAYLRATMTKREEILGRPLFEVFPDNPDDPSATGTSNLRASLDRVLKGRVTDVMAVQKYDIPDPNSPDGKFEERHWAPSNSPVLDEKDEVRYIIHRVEDVTEFVKLRKRERETADQFRARSATSGPVRVKSAEQELDSVIKILDESAILAITDRTGNIIHANKKFCEISKYSRDELLGKNHRILNSGHHPKEFFTDMWRTISSGKSWEGEIKNRAKDGTYYWVHTAICPVLDDRGRPDQYVAVRYEITQRKQTEETLNQSEAQVRQLQKMDAIGRLAGGVAHDFNNLLGAITMYCDLLADGAGDQAAVDANVREIRNAAERGAALTRQLLIFSRKQVVQLVPTNLNQVVSNLRAMLTRLIGENIEFVTKLEPSLKLVKADPGQIEQVITNLVVNARDAMPKGGRVVVESSNTYLNEHFSNTHLSVTPGHYVVLSVSDTGCGMDATTQSKLFEPFFTTKPMGKGTGLGLTTAYGIIKHCRGTIWVYSEVGKGTVFKIYLPIAEESPVETVGATPRVVPAKGAHTILLVEDDERLRRGYTEVLRRKGYEVLAAPDGKSALGLCAEHAGAIHLLLTDMVMPGLSGLELARAALEVRRDLRVLYMSGYTNETLADGNADLEIQATFIQKPFDSKTLLAKIQEVLEVRSRT